MHYLYHYLLWIDSFFSPLQWKWLRQIACFYFSKIDLWPWILTDPLLTPSSPSKNVLTLTFQKNIVTTVEPHTASQSGHEVRRSWHPISECLYSSVFSSPRLLLSFWQMSVAQRRKTDAFSCQGRQSVAMQCQVHAGTGDHTSLEPCNTSRNPSWVSPSRGSNYV